MLVAFAATGLISGSRLGNVSNVPPPAIAFTAPAANADEQRRAELQAADDIGMVIFQHTG